MSCPLRRLALMPAQCLVPIVPSPHDSRLSRAVTFIIPAVGAADTSSPTIEYELLRRRGRWTDGWKGIAALVGAAILVLVAHEIAVLAFGLPGLDPDILAAGTGLTIAGYFFWQQSAPWRLVRGRAPVAPRRSGAEFQRDFARQMSWPLLAWALLVFIGPIVIGVLAIPAAPLLGVPWTLFFALAWLQFARVAWTKWTMRGQD